MPVDLKDRNSWLAGRKKYIGSSDAAAIMGCGYAGQSASTVWNSKVLDVNVPFDEKTMKLVEEGRKCEPFVIERFRIAHPDLEVISGSAFDLTVSEDYPYLAASLDAEIKTDGGIMPLEAKWIGKWAAHEWEDGNAPLKYQFQVMHQMICTGADRGCLAAFVAGEWHERWIDRDDTVVDAMLDRYQKFWACVITRTPPDDSSPVAFSHLRPASDHSRAKILGAKASERVERYLEVSEQAAKATRSADRLKNQLASEVGDYGYLVLSDQTSVKVGKNSIKRVGKLPRGVIAE